MKTREIKGYMSKPDLAQFEGGCAVYGVTIRSVPVNGSVEVGIVIEVPEKKATVTESKLADIFDEWLDDVNVECGARNYLAFLNSRLFNTEDK